MTSQTDAISRAGAILAAGIRLRDSLSPRDAAELAFTPSGPSVNELEDRIRAQRGLPPIHATPQPVQLPSAA